MIAPVALTLGLIASAYAALRFVRWARADLPQYGAATLCFGLALGCFLTIVPLSGRVFRAFDPALITFAIAALAAAVASRKLRAAEQPRHDSQLWFYAAVVSMIAIYAWVSWKYQMHDEHPIFGHKSMIEQLRRGEYPIYLPPIPEQDARYHYGFDLLAGAWARAYGFSADVSIDLTTLLLVVFMCFAAAAIAADLNVPHVSAFAAVAIHLGSGLAWILLAGAEGRHPRCLVQYHHPSCSSELFPTSFNNVFQHPVAAGVPLFLASLLAARRVLESDKNKAFFGVLLLLLPALAVGQVVYFALGSLAMAAALIVYRAPKKRTMMLLAALLGGLILARLSGGMFTPSELIDSGAIAFRRTPGFPGHNLAEIARHHLINLGLGFALFPAFVLIAILRKNYLLLTLTAFAAGGMIVPHIWTYTRSWDIVKFPSAALFVLCLLYVVIADAAFPPQNIVNRWVQRAGRVLLLGSGFLAALFVAIPLQGDHKLYDDNVWKPDPLVKKAIDWFHGQNYRRDELIFAQSNVAQELSVFGGLSVHAADYDFQTLGIKQSFWSQREQHYQRIKHRMDPESIAALKVRYVVLSNEELDNLGPEAKNALQNPDRFEVAATFQGENERRTRRIWRVK